MQLLHYLSTDARASASTDRVEDEKALSRLTAKDLELLFNALHGIINQAVEVVVVTSGEVVGS